MRPGKELLLPFLTVMHLISYMASRPIRLEKLQEKLTNFQLALCHLNTAEDIYVERFFPGDSTVRNHLEPLEGITMPVTNTTSKELSGSICTIIDYLEHHLPEIVGLVTVEDDPKKKDLIINTDDFLFQFKGVVNVTETAKCHKHLNTTDTYDLKTMGLRMIYFTRLWVEKVSNSLC